LKVRREK